MSASAEDSPARLRNFERMLVDASAIVAVWGTLLLAENVALGFLWREQFTGAWEIALARHTAVPMALVMFTPLSAVMAMAWKGAKGAASGDKASAWGLALGGAMATAAMAMGMSGGRHFASTIVRVPFVLTMAASGALAAACLFPRTTTLRRRPWILAGVGLTVTIASWLADGYVLPRLYAGFHAAMLAATLFGAALIGLALRPGFSHVCARRALVCLVGVVVASCAAWTAHAVRELDRASNLRIALVEHAPLLGRAVGLATRIYPPTADDTPSSEGIFAAIAPGEVARALNWTGHDLVLLTVDALRADHVSAYGYARTTTPNIDGLASEGTLFESAYCPTPHTSYSVTSMLTGKYLRPLMALGLGDDSETWPQALRRYGWRTAAFYPPAVFFIDQDRFARFAADHLGFEYAKVEFADPALRQKQVTAYLDSATSAAPLFLWVHFFEPHEPYVVHSDHVFPASAAPDLDAYDSEVAAADDGIGQILRLVRARRPGAVVIVTADHGEEFGEHGGHYHGTTVYEEQVRVPLVVVGNGVKKGGRVGTVVQTIDLLPTALSALGMPRPARLRGRDLGSLLGSEPIADGGFAFAETDDYALVASGDDRLICARRAAACSLYRPRDDPRERNDIAPAHSERFATLNAMLREVERDHGHYEAAPGASWPEALRRAMQGEATAAFDAASLLDDADVSIRRRAAEVCFRFRNPATAPAAKRALARDEDEEVRRWVALALTRMGEPVAPVVDALLKDQNREWRHRAALVLAERGEGRACDEISASWTDALPALREGEGDGDGQPPRLALVLPQAEELLAATTKARCRSAVPALVHALSDVRARPYVADALGAMGDERGRGPLLALFADERYVTARPHEARALLALGARQWSSPTPAPEVRVALVAAARSSAVRLLVLLSDAEASLDVRAGGALLATTPVGTEVRALDLPPMVTVPVPGGRRRVELDLRTSSGGVIAAWLLPIDRLD